MFPAAMPSSPSSADLPAPISTPNQAAQETTRGNEAERRSDAPAPHRLGHDRDTPSLSLGAKVKGWLSRPSFWALALSLLFGVPLVRAVLRPPPPAPPLLGDVPSFSLRDQTGRAFGRADLAGKTWVADFVFTRCPTACPLLTQKMAEVERRAHNLGPSFHLVSFSVDPEHDTPEVLATYAAQVHADPQKWTFLTGPLGEIEDAVVRGFKIGVDRSKTKDDFFDIVHGEHLVVVDGHARIRGYFDISPEGLDRLMDTVGAVANEP
jgi:protein SCO1/2